MNLVALRLLFSSTLCRTVSHPSFYPTEYLEQCLFLHSLPTDYTHHTPTPMPTPLPFFPSPCSPHNDSSKPALSPSRVGKSSRRCTYAYSGGLAKYSKNSKEKGNRKMQQSIKRTGAECSNSQRKVVQLAYSVHTNDLSPCFLLFLFLFIKFFIYFARSPVHFLPSHALAFQLLASLFLHFFPLFVFLDLFFSFRVLVLPSFSPSVIHSAGKSLLTHLLPRRLSLASALLLSHSHSYSLSHTDASPICQPPRPAHSQAASVTIPASVRPA